MRAPWLVRRFAVCTRKDAYDVANYFDRGPMYSTNDVMVIAPSISTK